MLYNRQMNLKIRHIYRCKVNKNKNNIQAFFNKFNKNNVFIDETGRFKYKKTIFRLAITVIFPMSSCRLLPLSVRQAKAT